ncbi:hypothetical protein JCM30760_19470 [Thiomicrorhabdus hydrogeniphila]
MSRPLRMSYTVLARKWRPKNFSELVGQSHVMQALSNALDQQRLHHAYLFTGTRGVGKTTIARIFAKALNCEEGISSHPCGVCDTCRSIDEGRFIDLIEVDAASKTKVDDTREILDNVQFAPTQGRYKVYLIDEVHMLSKSSFNALLKTLEEPPEHVKFLLATTDPHKLPITVLSRCLQFNLMRLTQPQIQNHLAYILEQEQVPFEDGALALIAKSADGSARDSLSLLDQAIAYGAGQVMFEAVQTMLGLVDQQFGVAILNALAADDAEQIKTVIQQLATMGVDYQALLSQLIESLHAISYVQVFGDNETTTLLPVEIVQGFAQAFRPERVQLLYQVALLAKQDMQLAPDIRIGFEMALMRMLAFLPAEAKVNAQEIDNSDSKSSQNTSTQAMPSPQDALAGLATARSLVGKKNAEISPEALKPSGNNSANIQPKSIDYQDQPQTAVQKEVNPSVSTELPQEDLVDNSDERPNLKESENNYSVASSKVSSDSYNQNTMESSHQQAEIAPIPEPIAPEESHHSDHLAQIRARLKQPFGNKVLNDEPSTVAHPIDTTLQATEDESELPPKLSETLNNLNIQANQQNSQNQNADESESSGNDAFLENSGSLTEPPYQPDGLEHSSPLNALEEIEEAPPWVTENEFSAGSVNQSEFEPNAYQATSITLNTAVENTALESEPQTDLVTDENNQNTEANNNHPEFEYSATGDKLSNWIAIIKTLGLKGMAAEMANNSVLVELTDTQLAMSIDPAQQYAKPEMYLEQIAQAVKAKLGADIELNCVQTDSHYTPSKFYAQQESDKLAAAQNSIEADDVVQQLVSTLGMEVIPASIKPL